jgi:hypothetical protein
LESIAREKALEILLDSAHKITVAAKSLCPVQIGALQENIRVEHTEKGVGFRAGGYVTNPKTGRIVDYASFVEDRVQFMDQAFWSVFPEIEDRLKNEVIETLREAVT